ncbi:MAG TPA: gamma-glutamyl-gamma-aminobutyrate hydrolase family protein [bacterium]|nr:gamma-glutamyl-gamma-aminobutyrate hydrolase family protein [bacterium]
MKTLIINNHTKFLKELQSSFPGIVEILNKEDLPKKSDFVDYDLIVLSGGYEVATVAHHPDQYYKEIELVKKTKIPILGICLGVEIITYALGGELVKLDRFHQGSIKLTVIDQDLVTILQSQTIEVFEGHQWGVKTLPSNMISCGFSDHGPEIIKHLIRPIIGIQFHPEVTQNQKIFDWIIESLGIKK